jgi:hypothetical protein
MSRVVSLLVVVSVVLLGAAAPSRAAAGEDGSWDGVAGVQHLRFETEPITSSPRPRGPRPTASSCARART